MREEKGGEGKKGGEEER